jgi:hypothetical protein
MRKTCRLWLIDLFIIAVKVTEGGTQPIIGGIYI